MIGEEQDWGLMLRIMYFAFHWLNEWVGNIVINTMAQARGGRWPWIDYVLCGMHFDSNLDRMDMGLLLALGFDLCLCKPLFGYLWL